MGPRRPGNGRHARPGVSKHPDMANTEGGPPSSNKQTMSKVRSLNFETETRFHSPEIYLETETFEFFSLNHETETEIFFSV